MIAFDRHAREQVYNSYLAVFAEHARLSIPGTLSE